MPFYPVRKKAPPFGQGKKCAARVGSKAPPELSNGVYFAHLRRGLGEVYPPKAGQTCLDVASAKAETSRYKVPDNWKSSKEFDGLWVESPGAPDKLPDTKLGQNIFA